MFVRICEFLHAILGTIGVLRIVSMDGTPSRLPEDFVSRIAVELDEAGVMRLPKRLPKRERFRPGQRVRVSSGPLGELFGVFAGMAGAEKCRVLFDFLGIGTPVVVDVGLLRSG